MKLNTWRPRLKRIGLITIGLLTLAMITLTFVQAWVLSTAPDNFAAYGALPANESGFPPPDERGVFLTLNEPHNPKLAGNLIALLATTEPGVVDTSEAAHLLPSELKSVLVQSAILGEGNDYQIYRDGTLESDKMSAIRQKGGKVMLIQPTDGAWLPGAYLVNIPAEGMFGGRTYYQFYIDEPN
jgi:hypothetical protein